MGPIGIFDSGYGGLTVFKEIEKRLPEYDYLYLGDNARVPYGTRSFESVYRYTYECVQQLFNLDCSLVILACNTASAKALRSIQQRDLPRYRSLRRVLGVIRPTSERLDMFTRTKKVGLVATSGTVSSNSYVLEASKFAPDIQVYQQACPMWVPLVENNELNNAGTDFFVQKELSSLFEQSPDMDTLILACTHYPLLLPEIRKFIPENVQVVSQGPIVAASLEDYLSRHPEIEALCSKNGRRDFLTTETPVNFDGKAALFYGAPIKSKQIPLPFEDIESELISR